MKSIVQQQKTEIVVSLINMQIVMYLSCALLCSFKISELWKLTETFFIVINVNLNSVLYIVNTTIHCLIFLLYSFILYYTLHYLHKV